MSAIDQIKEAVGPRGFIDDPAEMAPWMADWRGLFEGKAALLVSPATTEEVAAVVKICADAGLAIVPQGGNTGLTRAGVPTDAGDQIVLRLTRMNKILDVDATGFTLTAEAGVTLQTIQQAAADADRLFPLSLAAEGSCQIGGNISTNAGGIHVLRYGNTRDLVLGLEVVLPDGEIWNGTSLLRKDNTGYDLKQLFIGGEGTLGIITKVTLKLFPAPKAMETAFIGLDSVANALKLLERMRASDGDNLVAFEVFPRNGLQMVLNLLEDARDPLEGEHPWYVLTEMWSSNPGQSLADPMEAALGAAMEGDLINDAAIIASGEQRKAVWMLRESFAMALKAAGAGFAFDVSVPVATIPEFIDRANAAVEALIPGTVTVPFGHAGDGNIHYNMAPPHGSDADAFMARGEDLSRAVHDIVVEMGGSISAEHGIGRVRHADLAHYKDKLAMDMMRSIKGALDPKGIMNPGVIV